VVLSGQGRHPPTPTVLSGQGSAAIFPPDLASNTANLAPTAPAVAVTPEVTAGTSIEDLNVSGAKPKTRFTLPFDFPNPFTFRKSRIPAATPVSQPQIAPMFETPVPPEAPPSVSDVSEDIIELLESVKGTPLQMSQIWT
jgi:hypothetical protein